MLIVQAPPAAGKSSMQQEAPKRIADTDDLIQQLGWSPTAGLATRILEDVHLRRALGQQIEDTFETGIPVLLTNFHLSMVVGLEPDYILAYSPDDYVAHIRRTNRMDLLRSVGEPALRSWMEEYVERYGSGESSSVTWLEPGLVLPDTFVGSLVRREVENSIHLERMEDRAHDQ